MVCHQVSLKYNKIPDCIPVTNTNAKNIGYDTKKIWTEYQLISRLLYRSRNQHKASFSFQHLKEVKKLGERLGKLENWLRGNFVEKGEKVFEFTGYLNTLRLLIEKTLEACRKSFYFYCQYLDQGLFVPLALVSTGSVSSLHNELMQWNKYVRILYNCQIEKIEKEFGKERMTAWCKENHLNETLEAKKETPNELKPPLPQSQPVQSNQKNKNQVDPFKHKQGSSSHQFKNKVVKKRSGGGDEIEDIFNNF